MPHDLKRKTAISIWILLIIIIVIISLIGSYFFVWFWIIFLPLSFLIVVAFQAISEHFWSPKKICPRCYAPVGIYSEYCRNCGLKLIKKCPTCGNYYKSEILACKKCGHQFSTFDKEKRPVEYQIIQKGTSLPEKPNFCPYCGSNLMNEKIESNFCPLCGEKIE